jgi:arylsulfatase A-like enzyme
MTDQDRRLRIRLLVASAAIAGAWLLVGWWIGPSVIRAAYEQRSIAFLNGLFEGRDVHRVDRYLGVWNRAALALLIALVAAAIAVQALLPARHRLRRLFDRVVRAEPTVSPAQALGLAISIGLLAGFAEYVQLEIKYRVDGPYSDWSNPDMLWMAPLALACAFDDYGVSVRTLLASSWITTAAANRVPGYSGNAAHLVRQHAPDINAEFLEWHARQDDDRPFFAFLNYFDAHDPHIARDQFAQRLGPPPLDSVQNAERNLVQRRAGARDNADRYGSMIAYVERHIGLLIDSLRQRGALQRAWIIITSDHGEQFGEHGLTYHDNSLYAQLLRVPLIVVPPGGLDRPIEIDAPVSLVDLFPTLLAIADADDGFPDAGASLLPMLDGTAPRATAPIIAEVDPNLHDRGLGPPLALGPMKSIVDGPWHYIRNGDGTEELYAFPTDPSEYDDRSGSPSDAATLRRLRAALDALSLPGAGRVADRAGRGVAGRND